MLSAKLERRVGWRIDYTQLRLDVRLLTDFCRGVHCQMRFLVSMM